MGIGCWLFLTGCQQSSDTQHPTSASYEAIDTMPMLIMQVQKCSKLYTSEFKVHKIVTHDDVIRLRGSVLQQAYNIKIPLGERKIAIPMDATLKAYIDFSQFSEKNIERSGDKITILLPDPKVTMTHFSDAEMTNYEQQGRAAILQSIPELGVVDLAKANAAKVIVPMVIQMGYKEENITVAFRKEFNQNNIMRLIER